jgi:hypothetical protein
MSRRMELSLTLTAMVAGMALVTAMGIWELQAPRRARNGTPIEDDGGWGKGDATMATGSKPLDLNRENYCCRTSTLHPSIDTSTRTGKLIMGILALIAEFEKLLRSMHAII